MLINNGEVWNRETRKVFKSISAAFLAVNFIAHRAKLLVSQKPPSSVRIVAPRRFRRQSIPLGLLCCCDLFCFCSFSCSLRFLLSAGGKIGERREGKVNVESYVSSIGAQIQLEAFSVILIKINCRRRAQRLEGGMGKYYSVRAFVAVVVDTCSTFKIRFVAEKNNFIVDRKRT